MRITDKDRELARDICVDLFDCTDERTAKALAIVLASHRLSGVDQTLCTEVLHGIAGMTFYCRERGPHQEHSDGITRWLVPPSRG